MHAQDRRIVERGGRQNRPELARFHLGFDPHGAHGDFHGGRQDAALELRQRIMVQMNRGIEGLHLVSIANGFSPFVA